MTQLLRDLLTDPELLQLTLQPRPTIEHETQEWCPECEQYVPELIYDICLNCLDDYDPDDPEAL